MVLLDLSGDESQWLSDGPDERRIVERAIRDEAQPALRHAMLSGQRR